MNKYKVANTIVKIIKNAILAIAFIYGFYVLATPGYYGFLVFYCVVALACGILYYKLKGNINKSVNARFPYYEDLIEHKYAVSYRKRFYNVWYLIFLIILNITVIALISGLIYKQCDNSINNRYMESIEYITNIGFDDDKFDCEVFRRLAPITPNSTKEEIAFCADIMEYTTKLVVQLNEWKKAGNVNEDTLNEYKDKFDDYLNDMNNMKDVTHVDSCLGIVLLIILKIASSELDKYTKHRSITL